MTMEKISSGQSSGLNYFFSIYKLTSLFEATICFVTLITKAKYRAPYWNQDWSGRKFCWYISVLLLYLKQRISTSTWFVTKSIISIWKAYWSSLEFKKIIHDSFNVGGTTDEMSISFKQIPNQENILFIMLIW